MQWIDHLLTKLACFVQSSFKNIFNTEYAAQLRSRVQNVVYHFEFSSVFLLPGVKCRQLDFSCLACQMCAFFWQLFFLSISLSFSLIHTHGGTAYTFKVSFATFAKHQINVKRKNSITQVCKGAYILRVYSCLTKNNPKTLYLANKNIFQKSFHVIRTILLDAIFGRKFVLLVQNRAFFLILPVKKVNNNKFSFQNFVLSSQNNIQDNMNKFKISRPNLKVNQ